MTTHIALLRGVNVGGHKKIAMSDLRRFVTDLGFDSVRSLLQSGNLIFRGGSRAGLALENLLEREAARRLDLQTTFLVRTIEEWQEVISKNPFRDEAESDPSHLVVAFLKDALERSTVEQLQALIKGPEIVLTEGRQLYIVYPAGIARSKLTNKLIEGTLETRVTGRNWNTVLKLAALAES